MSMKEWEAQRQRERREAEAAKEAAAQAKAAPVHQDGDDSLNDDPRYLGIDFWIWRNDEGNDTASLVERLKKGQPLCG